MAILYTYYGDDFTGSTDVLEQLGTNGIPAVLFLGSPSAAHLAEFPGVQAIGIAGDARSRSPEWMSANLPALFRRLQEFNAPVVHYKVCSTFDSSPTHGSIGRAIEIGLDVFSPRFVPIVVGAPHLRRYLAFGNLFAADPDGRILRIDRHPMARHPVTPMRESDLRVHLAAQTATKIGLIDTPCLKSGLACSTLDALVGGGDQAALFDTIDEDTQATVGELIWDRAQQHPIFAAASSGLTAALISAWKARGLCGPPIASPPLARSIPLLVLSGSCSETTQRQIRYALAQGYHGVALDPVAMLDPNQPARAAAIVNAIESLARGNDTILYTALGPTTSTAHGAELGSALGVLLREILARTTTPVHRVVICGGDTSSHAVQQLGINALTWAANIQPGGPLCRAHAGGPADGLELVLKGGQVGSANFFDLVRGC